jgi:hypothetical protein
MKDSPFFTEKYFHQFCIEGDTSNHSCGKHTGCHEEFVHGGANFQEPQCVNCRKEAYLKTLGKKGDENRVSKEEHLRIVRVNCGLETDKGEIIKQK